MGTTKDDAKPDATPPTDDTDNEKKALFGDMTEEELADMTDEERAGIDGGDDDDGEDTGDDGDQDDDAGDGDGDADDAEESDKDEGEDEEGDKDGDADDADGAADAGGQEDGADDGDAGEDETDEDDEEDPLDITRSVMPEEWQSLPKDADDKLKELNDQVAELAEKFDAGDLTAREYHQQQQTLTDQRFALQSQINDANKAITKARNDWVNRTVKGFLREHKEYSGNETLTRMLDGEVRALQEKTGDPFNPRILRKAHANLEAAMGRAPEPKTDGKKSAKKDKTPVLPGKKPPQVPPTLARVPQDEIEDAEGGRFARLERLEKRSPHEFEKAFAKLSAADQDAYLAGG